MTDKPRVLVAVFCGSERHHWLCPGLVRALLQMQSDARFTVEIEMLYALTPTDFARNTAVKMARDRKADWLLMLDNDTSPNADPLTVIATAPDGADVVAMTYGSVFGSGCTMVLDPIPGAVSGDFMGVRSVGTGCMALRSSVWKKMKGRWFKIVSDKDSELYTPLFSEDMYFCKQAIAVGLSIWMHRTAVAAHWHSLDLTALVPRR